MNKQINTLIMPWGEGYSNIDIKKNTLKIFVASGLEFGIKNHEK